MEFFNVGAGEVLVIALIGLLLFGPEDLLKIARTVGGYLNKAQRIWQEFSANLDTDLLQSEMEKHLPSDPKTAPPTEVSTSASDYQPPAAQNGA